MKLNNTTYNYKTFRSGIWIEGLVSGFPREKLLLPLDYIFNKL